MLRDSSLGVLREKVQSVEVGEVGLRVVEGSVRKIINTCKEIKATTCARECVCVCTRARRARAWAQSASQGARHIGPPKRAWRGARGGAGTHTKAWYMNAQPRGLSSTLYR